jgi:hypothetical protein
MPPFEIERPFNLSIAYKIKKGKNKLKPDNSKHIMVVRLGE